MKRKILLLLSFIFIVFSTYSADIDVTVYCDEGYQIYSYAENGIAKGLYVDILEKAFSKIHGYRVTIVPAPWKRCLKFVESGDGFAMFPPYYRPKERPWMDYSIPVIDEEVVLVLNENKAQKKRSKWPDDYSDLTIGLNTGFFILNENENKKIKIEEAKDTKTNLVKLGFGRIDGYINDKFAILKVLKTIKASGEYDKNFSNIIIALPIRKESGYIGYTKSHLVRYPYKDDFKRKVDSALEEMKKSGEIDKIISDYTK